MRTKYIAIVFAAAALASCSKPRTAEYVTAPAEYANISNSITATGTIEPVTTVEVGTQVSGIIDKIYVDYNSVVSRGQVIAELDKTNLLSELEAAQSNLTNAQSDLTYQKANYERYHALYEKGLVSANDYEQAKLSYDKARQTMLVQQQNVQKARTNLGYATITAPIDGVVLSKKVEEGQTVASAMTTPTLFIIAQDLADMRVIAKVDEADIGAVAEGQHVQFTVDAFPDDVFDGSVTQVRQEATTESNVVTYQVVIAAPNDDLKLKPGLTANVSIFTMEKDHVLTVPTKALRFSPSEAVLAPNQRIEDTDAGHKVWQLEGNVIKARAVEIGDSGNAMTEIIGGLSEGDLVITEFEFGTQAAQEESRNPFMPGPPGRRDNKDKKNEKK